MIYDQTSDELSKVTGVFKSSNKLCVYLSYVYTYRLYNLYIGYIICILYMSNSALFIQCVQHYHKNAISSTGHADYIDAWLKTKWHQINPVSFSINSLY